MNNFLSVCFEILSALGFGLAVAACVLGAFVVLYILIHGGTK